MGNDQGDHRYEDRNWDRRRSEHRRDYSEDNRARHERGYDRHERSYDNRRGSYSNQSRNQMQGRQQKRWKDSYRAGDADGNDGRTLYPVQSRTQSGTFNQFDYSSTNFKKQFNLTKNPKDLPRKANSDSENESEQQPSTSATTKNQSQNVTNFAGDNAPPEYGLKFNDEESDENEQYNYHNPNSKLASQVRRNTNFQEDQMDMFQSRKSRKRKQKRQHEPQYDADGNVVPFKSKKQEMKELAESEWEAVRKLPKGSGADPDADSGEEFSGLSGKAKRGKKKNKLLLQRAHIPIMPVMFQKASGVLGDASLEKTDKKSFDEMNEDERQARLKDLKQELNLAQMDYQSWKRDYMSWFVETFTMCGHLNGQEPVELLKKTEEDGFNKTEWCVQEQASKIRQYYMTYKITDMKVQKCQKEIERFNKKLESVSI